MLNGPENSSPSPLEPNRHAVPVFLLKAAKEAGREVVLESFSPSYLQCLVQECKETSMPKLVRRLEKVLDTRAKIHALEREMDTDFFTTLVTSGYLVRSGTERRSGGEISWVKLGPLLHLASKLRAGSPKGKACLRAILWIFETIHAQFPYEPGTFQVKHIDVGSALLDVNLTMLSQFLRILDAVFLVHSRDITRFFGMPSTTPILLRVLKKFLPRHTSGFLVVNTMEGLENIVTDPGDIPEAWKNSSAPRDFMGCFNRKNIWCFERCLAEKHKVETRDIFNPPAWPYDTKPRTVTERVQRTLSRLDPLDNTSISSGSDQNEDVLSIASDTFKSETSSCS